MKSSYTWSLTVLVVLITTFGEPLSPLHTNAQRKHVSRKASLDDRTIEQSRSLFVRSSLATAAAAVLFAVYPPPALAKDDFKGTKQDPAFEACLSNCMYNCLKPKGIEQKTRAECLPECKAKCATTKAQLMLGTPIKME